MREKGGEKKKVRVKQPSEPIRSLNPNIGNGQYQDSHLSEISKLNMEITDLVQLWRISQ